VDVTTIVKNYESLSSFVIHALYNFDSMESSTKAYNGVIEEEYAETNNHSKSLKIQLMQRGKSRCIQLIACWIVPLMNFKKK